MLKKNKLLQNIVEKSDHYISRLLKDTAASKKLWKELLSGHPADIAAMIEKLKKTHQTKIFKLLPHEFAAQVFEHLSDLTKHFLCEKLDKKHLKSLLREMSSDDIADLIELLPDHVVEKYLNLLQKEQRATIISLLTFDPHSAGGIMHSDTLTLPDDITVKKAVHLIQKVQPDLTLIRRLYVTDSNTDTLLGYVNLEDLITNKPLTSIQEIVKSNEVAFEVHEDQEKVARYMKHYDLFSAPVVDTNNHFLGVITADDVFDILHEEASEDIYKSSGITPMEHSYFQTPFTSLITQRVPWLISLLLLQSVSGMVLHHYNALLEQHIILSFFLTMLIGTGGNAGNQSGALVIRGLATGEISKKNGLLVLFREMSVSLIIALVLSVIGFIRVYVTSGDIITSLAINASLFLIIIVSMLLGTALPLILERFKFDPANSAQPFLATLMDIIGVIIYCVIASALLH